MGDLERIDHTPSLVHLPSKATGRGSNLLEALNNLGNHPKFQKWVLKRATGAKNIYAQVNPNTMEIEVAWQ